MTTTQSQTQKPELEFKTFGQLVTHLGRFPDYQNTLNKNQKEHLKKFAVQYKANYLQRRARLPIYYFRPNLPQSKLIYQKNRQNQMPRIMMFEGANKTGKTTFGVAWQISMAVGFFPWLERDEDKFPWHYDVSRRWKIYQIVREYCGFDSWDSLAAEYKCIKRLVPNFKVPNVNLAVGETFTESVDKDLVPKYLELIPKEWKPKIKKNQQGVVHKITLESGPGQGSVFYFRSYKSPDEDFEGIDTSGSILFNEPPPEDVVTSVMRGAMPYDTRVMFAYTALKEPWIYRNFVNKAATWLI
jgi:hypothetical protein